MSPTALALVLAGALGVIMIVLNHCHARLALVELALNEGLPPGHAAISPSSLAASVRAEGLESGVHVFLSRSCTACQRLLMELDELRVVAEDGVSRPLTPAAPQSNLHLHYVDRPRPQASDVAARLSATLTDREGNVAETYGADPLPFTIAVGDHGVVNGQATPTVEQLASVARDAGISIAAFLVVDQ